MERKRIKNFTLSNKVGELSALARETEDLVEKWELPGSMGTNINLVLEEALTNIINYAFIDSREHKIRISLSLSKDILTVRIKDDGIYFDPTSHKPPDISLPARERPVGGLGIFLISKIMDTVHYSRKKNLNILTLTKKI